MSDTNDQQPPQPPQRPGSNAPDPTTPVPPAAPQAPVPPQPAQPLAAPPAAAPAPPAAAPVPPVAAPPAATPPPLTPAPAAPPVAPPAGAQPAPRPADLDPTLPLTATPGPPPIGNQAPQAAPTPQPGQPSQAVPAPWQPGQPANLAQPVSPAQPGAYAPPTGPAQQVPQPGVPLAAAPQPGAPQPGVPLAAAPQPGAPLAGVPLAGAPQAAPQQPGTTQVASPQVASPEPKKKTGLIVAGVLGAVAAAAALFFGVSALTGDDEPEAAPTTTTAPTSQTTATDTTPTSLAPTGPPTVDQLAHSTVQVLVLDAADNITCTGSGTIISDDGTILTNAHVITPGGGCEVEGIAIAITSDAGQAPDILYYADLLTFDLELDLAVLRIAESIDGSEVPDTFPTTVIGDSDQLTLGETIRILGYPSIGGSTITFTTGAVSGFTSQAGVSDRSWIKTDATIAGGNSGGTAINDAGELVGIPTQISAGENAAVADCRVVVDTNGDNIIDELDQCIPTGGFLNGVRPVNLALPILEEARTAQPLVVNAAGQVADTGPVSLDELIIVHPGFSLGIGETIEDTTFTTTATAGAEELCFWFDWSGFPPGATWDASWFVDGELIEEFSYLGQPWVQEAEGRDFWLCAQAEDGLVAGLYELYFLVEGEFIFVEAIQVTTEPVEVFEVEFKNDSDQLICYLQVNPKGASGPGLDELGTEDYIEPGASYFLTIPKGEIIASAKNCDFEEVSGTSGILIEGNDLITIS